MLRIDRPTTLKFLQSLERKFHSIVSSCLRYGLCQELVHSSVISSATWIFSAATHIDLCTIFFPGKEMSWVHQSQSFVAQCGAIYQQFWFVICQTIVAIRQWKIGLEVETSAQASAELWKRLVDFSSAQFLYRWSVCDFFIVLKRKCLEVVVINRNAFFNYNFNKYFTIVRGFSGIVRYWPISWRPKFMIWRPNFSP